MRIRHTQLGFGLVEVLIASVVLAVGLLGLASLQSRAMKITKESDNQATAVMLAQDLIQRTQANIQNFERGRVSCYLELICIAVEDGGDVEAWAAQVASSSNFPEILDCYTSTGCEPSIMSYADIVEWKRLTNKMLPNGYGKICMDTPVNFGSFSCNNRANADSSLEQSIFVVKIKWTSLLDNTDHLYVTEFNSKCTDSNGCTPAGDNITYTIPPLS